MIDQILLFIQQNAQWAAWIVFIVALLESIAIVGLLVPGWVLLVGVGTLIGGNVLPFYPMVVAAYIGAVLGEYFSYWLGFHYHERVLAWKFVARHELLIEKSRMFFQRHGISGVFIGRFFGPTRAVVPFIAGVSEMPKQTFFWVNLISGLLWAPLYLIPGILVGAAISLDESAGSNLLGILLLLSIAATLAWNYTKLVWLGRKTDQNKVLLWLKAMLALGIFLMSLIIFVKSPYFPMLGQIIEVLFTKVSE